MTKKKAAPIKPAKPAKIFSVPLIFPAGNPFRFEWEMFHDWSFTVAEVSGPGLHVADWCAMWQRFGKRPFVWDALAIKFVGNEHFDEMCRESNISATETGDPIVIRTVGPAPLPVVAKIVAPIVLSKTPTLYTLAHSLGLIQVTNGSVLGCVTWMGGDKLSGDQALINIVRAAFAVNAKHLKTFTRGKRELQITYS